MARIRVIRVLEYDGEAEAIQRIMEINYVNPLRTSAGVIMRELERRVINVEDK